MNWCFVHNKSIGRFCWTCREVERVEALRAAETPESRVRDLHKPITQKGWRPDTTETVCSECVVAWSGDHQSAPWPCATINALEGKES